jgi:hypothetical protein
MVLLAAARRGYLRKSNNLRRISLLTKLLGGLFMPGKSAIRRKKKLGWRVKNCRSKGRRPSGRDELGSRREEAVLAMAAADPSSSSSWIFPYQKRAGFMFDTEGRFFLIDTALYWNGSYADGRAPGRDQGEHRHRRPLGVNPDQLLLNEAGRNPVRWKRFEVRRGMVVLFSKELDGLH